MNHMFMRQLEDVERENTGFLILKRCPDDSNNIHKRCKGSVTYRYPDILQVRGPYWSVNWSTVNPALYRHLIIEDSFLGPRHYIPP